MNVVLALVAVLGVSASGPLMAYASAPALAIGFWRNALGAAAIAPFSMRSAPGELVGLDRRGRWALILAGVMLALHFATWITALQLTSVASATAMVSMQIVFVVIIDRLLGATVPRQVVIGTVVSLAGVLVVTGVDFSLAPRALVGDLLGLAGGAAAAVYLVAGSEVRRQVSTGAYTVACYGLCALVLALGCLVSGADLGGYASSTWAAIVGVTVCAQLLGHSVLNHLLAVMSPTVISLLLLLEVPGAALLAGVFLGQTPPLGVYAGLALILAGLAVVVMRRTPTEAPPT